MTFSYISLGSDYNVTTADSIRDGLEKVNNNFYEIDGYGGTANQVWSLGSTTGSTAAGWRGITSGVTISGTLIYGGKVDYGSSTTVTTKPYTYSEGSKSIFTKAIATIDITAGSVANGRTSALGSGWWYLYAIGKSTGSGAFILSKICETVTGSITFPITGSYINKRQMPFALYAQAATGCIRGFANNNGEILYNAYSATDTSLDSNFQIAAYASNTPTVWTTVSAATYVPRISKKGLFGVGGSYASSSTGFSTLQMRASSTSATIPIVKYDTARGRWLFSHAWVPVTGSQGVQFDTTPTTLTGSALATYIDVIGFKITEIPLGY